MSAPDDRILEIAAEDSDGVVKVGKLSKHRYIHVGQSQVSRRCSVLAEHGLLRNFGDGVYVITDAGRAYLEEEYDAEAGMFVDELASETAEGPKASDSDESGVNGV